jgi:hypothetical protein
MRLRSLMIVVAVAGFLLGLGVILHRRADRLNRLALSYQKEAGRLEHTIVGPGLSRSQVQGILDRVHWNDAVAWRYRHAADRPWLPTEPDPEKVACECGYHLTLSPSPGDPARLQASRAPTN